MDIRGEAWVRSSFTSSRFWELLYLILCMWPGFEQNAQFLSYQSCQWDMVVFVEGGQGAEQVGRDRGQFPLHKVFPGPRGPSNTSPLSSSTASLSLLLVLGLNTFQVWRIGSGERKVVSHLSRTIFLYTPQPGLYWLHHSENISEKLRYVWCAKKTQNIKCNNPRISWLVTRIKVNPI